MEDKRKADLEESTLGEHISPAVVWLKQQPEKKFVIKMENLPYKAVENNLTAFLLKNFPDLNYSKIVIDRDSHGVSKGTGWFASEHKPSLAKVLSLHNKVRD